jgi:hypothetical protein
VVTGGVTGGVEAWLQVLFSNASGRASLTKTERQGCNALSQGRKGHMRIGTHARARTRIGPPIHVHYVQAAIER